MNDSPLSFLNRLILALRTFGRILIDEGFAVGVLRLEEGAAALALDVPAPNQASVAASTARARLNVTDGAYL